MRVPLLNFERGPESQVLVSWGPRSWGPGPTFTPCRMNISHSLCNILNCHQFRIFILAHIESFQEYLGEMISMKSAREYHLLKQIAF